MESVQVFNASKGVVIAHKAQIARRWGQRMKGLLGRISLPADEALILPACSSIHTFFMRFAIDVLFLDNNMHIIRLLENFPASRLSPLVWNSRMTIELPAGKISQTHTQLGDRLELR